MGTPNRKNIQGDIWPGLPKRCETLLFFSIADGNKQRQKFKEHLQGLIPHITTAHDVLKTKTRILEEKATAASVNEVPRVVPFCGVNIAFSATGLAALGKHVFDIYSAKKDPARWREVKKYQIRGDLFDKGMFEDLTREGWDNPEELRPEYKPDPVTGRRQIDGVVLIAACSEGKLERAVGFVKEKLHMLDVEEEVDENTVCRLVSMRKGNCRPGPLKGKEHFGYRHGLSQPQMRGLDPEPLGSKEPKAIPPGLIFLKRDGDPLNQPAWAKDGSFLVFRDLQQFVPEFERFLEENADQVESTGPHPPSEKLAALLMGRWRNGTPLDLNPYHDNDTSLHSANDFDFNPIESQERCPFAAHIRKTRPRAELADDTSVIIRRGIPYGPEVSDTERKSRRSEKDRGLLFLCYQSDIRNGFNFITTRWASNHHFPNHKQEAVGPEGPGVDAFAAQRLSHHPPRSISLPDSKHPSAVRLDLDSWVVHRGGEYFFTPSVEGLWELCSLSHQHLNARRSGELRL
ncbi:hypothetical protein ETB97_004611 [Aspergillus alliaceus]|uniref:Dyp-type peroxidase n=1 Tax=Petromyces alliaceus TaxID=209559 RepID=A0A8H5ZYS0_PETAA|nr:hypothetical protein ETB97_004611 [Aspergillus burnettii]